MRRRGLVPSLLAALSLAAAASGAHAQASDESRGLGRGAASRTDSLALVPVEVSPAIEASVRADGGSESLARFESVLGDRLAAALAGTRKFTMVARDRLGPVLQEQAFSGSSLVDPRDPATARALKIAGVRWLAVPRIVDFEDITRERRFEGIDRMVSRRTLRVVVNIDVLDSTTGVVGDTATVTLDSTDTADEDVRARPEGGDPTNVVLDRLAGEGADRLACRLLDVAYPVRVLAVNGSTVTIDRGDGACMEVGDRRVVSSRGRALRDPDTGEILGHDESDVGVIEITRMESRLARATLLEGDARTGDVLRVMPADGKVVLASRGDDSGSGAARDARMNRGTDPSASAAGLGTVAIVVRTTGTIDPPIAREFQSQVVGAVSSRGVRVVDSSLIVADEADDSGERSPLSIAEAIGAERMLVVDLTSLARNSDSVVAPGGRTTRVDTLDLKGSWSLSSVSDGASLAGRAFDGTGSRLQSSGDGTAIDIRRDLLPQAIGEASNAIADALAIAAVGLAAPVRNDADSGFIAVNATLDGLVVPEISRDDRGQWVVGSSSLPVIAGGVEVSLDGFVVGSTPCVIEARKGPHQLSLTRQGVEGWSRAIRVMGNDREDPQVLQIGLRLSEGARDRYLENAGVIEDLKTGAALTDAQVAAIEGFAKFLAQSGYRVDRSESRSVDIDSDQVPEVMQWNSFWNRW